MYKEYKNLDNEKLQAILSDETNTLVSAGPGSGKTTVIVYKVYHLIKYKNINPRNIIILTFTKAAANNMKDRYKELAKSEHTPFFGTFHGLFYKILTHYYGEIKIMNSSESFKLIRSFLSSYMDEVSDDKVKEYLNAISIFKSSGLNLFEFETKLDKDLFKNAYEIYESYKKEKGLCDFDDLQIMCKQLFIKNPKLLNGYSNMFKYILIDEFQDCDELQIEILKMLNKDNFVFAVGDEDQCIYSFRGSKPKYMITFEENFKDSKILYLQTNYRCAKNIVSLSNDLIKHNKSRRAKTIIPYKKIDGDIRVLNVENDTKQGLYIANHIEKTVLSSNYNYSDFAILYRTNLESRRIIDTFIKRSIPFKLIDKEFNFFNHFICKDILSYLKLSLDMKNKDAFTSIINKPFRYISKNAIEKIKSSKIDIDCFETLKELDNIRSFQIKNIDELKLDIHNLNKMSLGSAISFIINSLGYYDYLREYTSRFKIDITDFDSILDEFQSIATEHRTIVALLSYIEEYNDFLHSNKNNSDGVILSTIHSVKGMEFKNIFIINAVEGYIPHESNIEDNLEEERRLMYVALTRAIDNLYILIPSTIQNKTYKISPFIKECNYKLKLPFDVNDTVIHGNNNEGIVTYIDEDIIEIKFTDQCKRFDLKTLINYDLLRKLPK
ncbi:ATP-dependent helicase [Clostridium sp. ATCC 25772]|uniref:ATP-dependent helicase n=1 Tax=Clostridium sp. ATCC 25772 TaxID=1676991 RepID=UPI000781E126|nr:ATP-dependent helicase [Clostridium sp. ATCC 25772]